MAEKGGVYTGRGTYLPPSPDVTDEVREWGELINEARRLNFTPKMITELVNFSQQIRDFKSSGKKIEQFDWMRALEGTDVMARN